jgi:hypothetical protein
MIEMQRTPSTRILKQRDIQDGAAIRPALTAVDAALPRSITPTPPAVAQRCSTKEARLVADANGAQAVEVRCSCGEWTRVELQVGTVATEAR